MPFIVPDHDELVEHIQSHVAYAIKKVGWPEIRVACKPYNISETLIRRIHLWSPDDDTSFNLRKLIEVYDFAEDIANGRRVRDKSA